MALASPAMLSSKPSASFGRRSVPRRTLTTRAALPFGFGKSKAEVEREREEEWRAQQELIEKRRSGAFIKEASERRQSIAREIKAKKEERRAEREALARGEMPDTLKNWQPYDKETNENANRGVVVPLLPFGMPKYDNGERFDLRNPFFETGYIDPDEMSPLDSLKRFGKKVFDFSLGRDGSIERDAKKQVLVPDVDNLGKKPFQPKGKKQ